jgi:DNA-binding winged helix-turn-helix (wHTH) protein
VKLEFGEFAIDSESRLLSRKAETLHLSPKAFDALWLLIERRPGAVTKDDLHARLWSGTFVVDANLSVTIAEVRRALGDDPRSPRFIRTVHRIGYSFCADAREVSAPIPGPARAWLTRSDRVLHLRDGENIVGRDPGSDVWIDEIGVSRRHARLQVEPGSFTVEDLGSKNGTWLNEAQATTPVRVHDGDRLQFGPVAVEFRAAGSGSATRTVRLARKE